MLSLFHSLFFWSVWILLCVNLLLSFTIHLFSEIALETGEEKVILTKMDGQLILFQVSLYFEHPKHKI